MSLEKARALLASNPDWYDVDDDLEELFGKRPQIGEALWTLFRDGSWTPNEGFLDAMEQADGFTPDDVARLIENLANQPNRGGLRDGWDSDLTRMMKKGDLAPVAGVWRSIPEPVRTPMGFHLASLGALTADDLPPGTLAARAAIVTGSVSGYHDVQKLVAIFGEEATGKALAHAGGQDGCDIWSSKWVALAATVATAEQQAAILARCDYYDCVLEVCDELLQHAHPGLADALDAFAGEKADHGETAFAYTRCMLGCGTPADVEVLINRWQGKIAERAPAALAKVQGAEAPVAHALRNRALYYCPWGAVAHMPTPEVLTALCERIAKLGRGDGRDAERIVKEVHPLPPEAADTLLANPVGKKPQRQAWTHLLGVTGNPKVIPALIQQLGDSSKANVQTAVDALKGFGAAARPALEDGTRAKKKAIREACAEVLAELVGAPSDGMEARVDALLAQHPKETAQGEVAQLIRNDDDGIDPARRQELLDQLGDVFWTRAWTYFQEWSWRSDERWLSLKPQGEVARYLSVGFAVRADPADAARLLEGADVARVRSFLDEENLRSWDAFYRWVAENDPEAPQLFATGLGARAAWQRQRAAHGIRYLSDRSCLLPLLNASKASLRQAAAELIAEAPPVGADKALAARIKKEKSDKVKAALVNALVASQGAPDFSVPPDAKAHAALDKQLAQAGQHLSGDHDGPGLSWSSGKPLSTAALRRVLQLMEETDHTNHPLDGLRPHLAGRQALLDWLREQHAGSKEARLGWVLFADALLADDDAMLDYGRPMDDLARGGSFKTAEYMLTVLVRQGSNPALQWVDHWARKARSQGLKAAAIQVLDAKARQMGVSRDALAETLVPHMGFGTDRTQPWPHGDRTFTIRLGHHNQVQILDDAGAVKKSLPSARKGEDADAIKASKKRLTALKKQLKQATTAQLERMEDAMVTGRTWSRQAWTALYVDNPVLSSLARTALWSDGTLFRVAEDGTAANLDDDLHTVGDAIRLVHPIEVPNLADWAEVFGDYELIVPFDFFQRDVHRPTADEDKHITRLKGHRLTAGQLRWGLEKRRWRRGAPQDGGAVCWFTKVYGDVTAIVDFSDGFGIGYMDDSDPQTLDKVHFVQGAHQGRPWRGDAVAIADVPPVAFSEVVRDILAL